MDKLYYKSIINKIDSLCIFSGVAEDSAVHQLKKLCGLEDMHRDFSLLANLLIESAEIHGFAGNLLKKHLIYLFLTDENIFSMRCENGVDVKNSSVYRLALNDVGLLRQIAEIDLSQLCPQGCVADEIAAYTPITKQRSEAVDMINLSHTQASALEAFMRFYRAEGCGKLAEYRMFKYDVKHGLVGIDNYDRVTFEDLIGYEAQVSQLINNTEAFMNGFPANNVLLVGSRGTGKSSSVKALANEYFDAGLRLVEISKEQITHISDLLKQLEHRGKRFIIFIDDLSFGEDELQYKYLKSLLDGGTEAKPENVLFCATSNRRHLIQEKWSDRSRGSEEAEIHTTDTLNEKLSLADRFGITITFPKPTPAQYIEIVKGIAAREGLLIPSEQLEKEAMKWELNQKGLSGRTARQFINSIISQSRNTVQAL